MEIFRVLILYENKYVGRFSNLHQCTFNEKLQLLCSVCTTTLQSNSNKETFRIKGTAFPVWIIYKAYNKSCSNQYVDKRETLLKIKINNSKNDPKTGYNLASCPPLFLLGEKNFSKTASSGEWLFLLSQGGEGRGATFCRKHLPGEDHQFLHIFVFVIMKSSAE